MLDGKVARVARRAGAHAPGPGRARGRDGAHPQRAALGHRDGGRAARSSSPSAAPTSSRSCARSTRSRSRCSGSSSACWPTGSTRPTAQLHNAKRELAAEDITADIFPGRRRGHLAAALRASRGEHDGARCVAAGDRVCRVARALAALRGGAAPASRTGRAAPRPRRPRRASAPAAASAAGLARRRGIAAARARRHRLACRAIAVDGRRAPRGAARRRRDASPLLLRGRSVPDRGVGRPRQPARGSSRRTRARRARRRFRGPGAGARVRRRGRGVVARVGRVRQLDRARARRPGARSGWSTPLGVVRYGAAKLSVDVRPPGRRHRRRAAAPPSSGRRDDARARRAGEGADDRWGRAGKATSGWLGVDEAAGACVSCRPTAARIGTRWTPRAPHAASARRSPRPRTELTGTLMAGGADAAAITQQVTHAPPRPRARLRAWRACASRRPRLPRKPTPGLAQRRSPTRRCRLAMPMRPAPRPSPDRVDTIRIAPR